MASMSKIKSHEIYEIPNVLNECSETESHLYLTGPRVTDDGSIITSQVAPESSFGLFENAHIDYKRQDFSDSISNRRKTHIGIYEILNKKKNLESSSLKNFVQNEVQDETTLQRYHRLRAEVSEFIDQLRSERDNASSVTQSPSESQKNVQPMDLASITDTMFQLQSDLLAEARKTGITMDSLLDDSSLSQSFVQTDLTKQLIQKIHTFSDALCSSTVTCQNSEFANESDMIQYELYLRKDTSKQIKLAKLADLEQRLSDLEHVVYGSQNPIHSRAEHKFGKKSLVEFVEELSAKVDLLDDQTIDRLLDRLSVLRESYACVKALDDEREASDKWGVEKTQVGKLFKSLDQVNEISSQLSFTIKRLRQLRSLHEGVSEHSRQIQSIRLGQVEIGRTIKKNGLALSQLEECLSRSMKTIEGNLQIVEGRISQISYQLARRDR
ncbi:dynactin subunit 2-B-like [Schistocerca gregaria]|uniref:dynactin subunit 2-B-like n=1 Tax=Schistocerca gregaria TaxID=7010 RepID=UPI00211DF49E|nr:dynactin subunit 2-B-like [Schistocerca gregaria]